MKNNMENNRTTDIRIYKNETGKIVKCCKCENVMLIDTGAKTCPYCNAYDMFKHHEKIETNN